MHGRESTPLVESESEVAVVREATPKREQSANLREAKERLASTWFAATSQSKPVGTPERTEERRRDERQLFGGSVSPAP